MCVVANFAASIYIISVNIDRALGLPKHHSKEKNSIEKYSVTHLLSSQESVKHHKKQKQSHKSSKKHSTAHSSLETTSFETVPPTKHHKKHKIDKHSSRYSIPGRVSLPKSIPEMEAAGGSLFSDREDGQGSDIINELSDLKDKFIDETTTIKHKGERMAEQANKRLKHSQIEEVSYIGMQMYPNSNADGKGLIKINQNGIFDLGTLNTVSVFYNSSIAIIHNNTHYAILPNDTRQFEDLKDLWQKQTKFKKFDDAIKLPESLHIANFWDIIPVSSWIMEDKTPFRDNRVNDRQEKGWHISNIVDNIIKWINNKWEQWTKPNKKKVKENNENVTTRNKNIKIQARYDEFETDNEKFDHWKRAPKKIKDDTEVDNFTDYLINRTLKLFDLLTRKNIDPRSKTDINHVAEKFKDKFQKLIQTIRPKTFETKVDLRRAILNSIHTSNNIVKRVINTIINNAKEKGSLRRHSNYESIDEEIKKELETQLKEACSRFDICLSR